MIPKIKIFKNKFGNPKFSYVSIVVLVGSIFEKEEEKGISHFIEHLIFKGSEYNENIKILNNKLNSKGMNVNAYTNPFITNFHINTPTEYIKEAIDALVQIVFNPLFRDEDVENERKVVINELIQKSNSPDNLAFMFAQRTIYPKENPLHNPVIGYVKTLKKISRNDIINYYKSFYKPQNIIFFTSSSINESSLEKIWKKSYEEYGNKTQIYNEMIPTLELFKQMKPKLGLVGKPGLFKLSKYFPMNTSIYVLINFILENISKKEMFSLDIFSNYLAGSLSSKLFLELREKKQLIYSINADTSIGINNVNFSIDFNCKKNNKVLIECFKTIDKVIRDFYKNGLPDNEFDKFKNKTLINYQKVKSSGIYKINRFLDKYYYEISEYDYENIIKSITNNYLHNTVKKILLSKKEYVFIA